MPSSVPGAIDALLATLRSAPGLTGVQVFDGVGRVNVDNMDFVAIGGWPEPTVDGERQPASIGQMKFEEVYALRVYCQSSRGGEDQAGVRRVAFDLADAVTAAVLADPTLDGSVREAYVAQEFALQQTDAENATVGSVALVSLSVVCKARI